MVSESDPTAVVGRMFGHYRLNGLLGRGGMGDVYRAYDTRRDREVALKILAARGADDGTFAQRFQRECQVVARLGEPHVIPIHDYGDIDGALYLDMRLVDGENLRGVIERDGAMAPERALAIIDQVAAALGAAHAAGIVHRDVKPENILLTSADFAYLVDFGIAVADQPGTDRLTRTGTAVGSAAYMAPEQFDGQPVSRAVDTYALTAVLYELLTGAPAHRGATLSEVLKSVLVGPVVPASRVRPNLPAAVDEVLARGLNTDPSARFTSPGEMVAAARAALQRKAYAPTAVNSNQVNPNQVNPNQVNQPGPYQGNETPAYSATRRMTVPQPAGVPSSVGAPPVPVMSPQPAGASPPAYGAQVVVNQPASGGRGQAALWIAGAALLIGALVAVIAMLVLDHGGSGDVDDVAAPPVSESAAEQPATTIVTEQVPAVTTTTTQYRSVPGRYGIGLNTYLQCSPGPASAVFTGYSTTTCGFATNVARELVGRDPNVASPVTVYADSPEVGPGLPMACRLAHDSDRSPLWKCVGGASGNAVVYVYP